MLATDNWSRLKRQSSSCLACTDPVAPCACTASQSCVMTARTCNQCTQNICQDAQSSRSSGKASVGGTVGGALGGVLGILAAVAAVYFFWWKPRGLAASRKRYSRHLTARQSRMMAAAPSEKKESTSPPVPASAGAGPGAGGDGADGVAKRTSVHLRIDGGGSEAVLSHRPSSPTREEESVHLSSTGATGGHSRNDSAFDGNNPFGDHARSSVGTSDFSFRSSHSTNIIPIAYIPPYSSSLSVEDGNRGAYGELDTVPGDSRLSALRHSVAGSFASQDSRDSLALAGADGIVLNPLPPVLTPGSPIVPLSASASGGPIRPPRSPGLDLQLPKGTPSTSPLGSPDAPRPASGFPWSAPPLAAGASHFSLATRRASANSYLTAPGSASNSPSTSTFPDKPGKSHHLSTLSTISSSTNRSNSSTMSYILDPPQIITPVNAQALRRVEVLGRGQAGLVRIAGSAAPATPSTPAADGALVSVASSPTTPKALAHQPSTFVEQQQAAPQDPFADIARFSVGGLTAAPLPTSIAGQPQSEAGYTAERGGFGTAQLNDSRWTLASAEGDMPQSARNSGADTGSHSRPLTGAGIWAPSIGGSEADLRASIASSASSLSMLDGIPFLDPSSTAGEHPPSSPRLPMSPPSPLSMVTALAPTAAAGGPPSPTASLAASSYAPHSDHRGSQYSYDTAYSDASPFDAPLVAPIRPFAPSAVGGAGAGARQSEAISVRSGFGSGLSQIPFQLGFPSGLDGGSDRGSLMTMDSRMDDVSRDSLLSTVGGGGGRRESYVDEDDDGVLSGVDEVTEPATSRPTSSQEENPFGAHAEVDPRASTASRDSMAIALS